MPALTLVFGNKNYSSWSLRPWLFLKHHGIEFTENRVPLFTATTDATLEPYFSDYKVPVLVDGDLTIWDSLSILEYVSENYLNGRGWPADPAARAVARSISAEMHSSFSDLRSELPMNCRKKFLGFSLSDGVKRNISRVKDLWKFSRQYARGDGPWLFGEFSIADAMYAPVVMRFYGYDVKLDGFAAEYRQTMLGHDAIKEWVAAGELEKEVIKLDEI